MRQRNPRSNSFTFVCLAACFVGLCSSQNPAEGARPLPGIISKTAVEAANGPAVRAKQHTQTCCPAQWGVLQTARMTHLPFATVQVSNTSVSAEAAQPGTHPSNVTGSFRGACTPAYSEQMLHMGDAHDFGAFPRRCLMIQSFRCRRVGTQRGAGTRSGADACVCQTGRRHPDAAEL